LAGSGQQAAAHGGRFVSGYQLIPRLKLLT
jgi:hypothetical protein